MSEPGYEDWTGDDWSMLAECCDDRPIVRDPTGDGQCACPEHPRSYAHPFGEREWPAP
jgi:hypothetical protein